MRSSQPGERQPSLVSKQTFVATLVLTIVVMIALQLLGAPLVTDAAPQGIVSFEFAGRLPVAQAIMESWGPTGRVAAGLSLGLDYLFLFAYASAIGLGCALMARALATPRRALSQAGVFLARAQIVAAGLDAVENYALIQLLLGSERTIWPAVAQWCATPKFVIVAAGLLYLVVGYFLNLW